MRNIQRCTA